VKNNVLALMACTLFFVYGIIISFLEKQIGA